MNSVEYSSSPASVYHVTGSCGISIPSLAILDTTELRSRPSFLWRYYLYRCSFYWKTKFLVMSAISDPATPTQKSCPGLLGKGCGKFLATWDDHVLFTSCRHVALEPCLGIFACPTCVDWTKEQHLHFSKRHTYRKKAASPCSDLDDLLFVCSANMNFLSRKFLVPRTLTLPSL